MAGPIDGMEVPNTVIGGYGVQSCGAGYDGLWRHGEYDSSRCLAMAAVKLDTES